MLVVRGARVVAASGMAALDILVADGRINGLVAPGTAVPAEADVIDASGLVILPGLIDGHTHFVQDDPAQFDQDPDEYEGFTAGGRGAAAGGVTTVVEMPQARPLTVDGATFARKRELAAQDSIVDFALWGGVIKGTTDEQIDEQLAAGAVGLKAFMCDSDPAFPALDDDQLLRSLAHVAGTGRMLGVHAESDNLLQAGLARMAALGRRDPIAHAESRPPIVEVEAVSRAILLAESVGAWIHIVHLSAGAAADVVARAKARGVQVTCETCPQYLALDHDDLRRLRGFARCAPAIRAREDVEHVWERLRDGTIDAVTTDHCAFTVESKQRGADDIFQAPCGLPGVETFLPIVVTEARRRGFGFEDVARLTATAPAELWQLAPRKGAIAVGADADLAFLDPDATWTIRGADLHHTHRWTPFQDRTVTGRVVRTLVRGQTVFSEADGVVGEPGGGVFVPAQQVAAELQRA